MLVNDQSTGPACADVDSEEQDIPSYVGRLRTSRMPGQAELRASSGETLRDIDESPRLHFPSWSAFPHTSRVQASASSSRSVVLSPMMVHSEQQHIMIPLTTVNHEHIRESLTARFQQMFGGSPRIFRAPGRVNLIGEHTDYNDGFVMPAAIEFYTSVALGKRNDRLLQVYSEQFAEKVEISLDTLAGPPRRHWSDFIRGVAAVLEASGNRLSGANLSIDGQVPLGAGLSSSASLEVSTALALMAASDFNLPAVELAKLCQRAEHEYVGTRCGIMDQFIAVFGRSGHALMLDCRSLQYELLPIPPDVRLVICNTTVKHDLAAGEYNRRRADCETGVRAMQQHLPNVLALRDVTFSQLETYRNELPDRVYRRCRHVIRENERVLTASGALRSGNLARFGQLMYESHNCLRDDYQVSCRELDLLVELASACDGVLGARMTGGGFGGCTINLVRADAVDRFQHRVQQAHRGAMGHMPETYVCSAAQGAGEW